MSEPSVPFDRVRSVAPRTIVSTVELDGESLTRHVPVAVERSETQYL